MTWSRSKLEQVANSRRAMREKLQPVERAALAYALTVSLTASAL
jgi:hypothetical protein